MQQQSRLRKPGMNRINMKIKINKLKCRKCKHEWIPRVEKVYVCPKCHTYLWEEKHEDKDENKDKV